MGSVAFSICEHCDDRIGVYEPLVVVEPTGFRETSLAREPELRSAGKVLLHAACAALIRERSTFSGARPVDGSLPAQGVNRTVITSPSETT
jgi:hypothetical protein